MSIKFLRLISPLGLLTLMACSGPDNCPEILSAQVRAMAQCSILEVPQNRTRNTGLILKLPVIRFNSPVKSNKPPLLYLEGGPGFTVLGKAEQQGPGLAQLLKRDIIFLEQRGAPNAWPSLVCKDIVHPERCLEEWARQKVDLASFNTIENAEDVADLSVKEGTPFVLWGSSYGTLLAQRVVQRHPEVVESLVLEGSVPSSDVEKLWRSNRFRAPVLKRFSQWVKKKWAESRLTPDDINPEIDFPEAIKKISEAPFHHGVPGNETLAGALVFLETGRGYPDQQLSLSLWAYQVRHGLDKQRSAEWLESMLFAYGQSNQISFSERMYFSTNCSDAYQFWSIFTISEAKDLELPDNMSNVMMKNYTKLLADCKALGRNPSGYPAEQFNIPAKTNKKTLFLIGMLDTQTPAELAPIANFPNATVVRGECLGHSFFQDERLFGILKSFLDNPDGPVPYDLIDSYCARPITQPTLAKSM
jgi:pimeloyl-ACP methyl ester carboxylesterase